MLYVSMTSFNYLFTFRSVKSLLSNSRSPLSDSSIISVVKLSAPADRGLHIQHPKLGDGGVQNQHRYPRIAGLRPKMTFDR